MRTRNVTIWIAAVVVLALCGTAQATLVAHWQFDEGQGGTAYDSVGSNNGTIHGAQWTTGKVGDWALDFDGVNDYVETIGNILNLPMNDHTIALWAKKDGISSTEVIIHAGDTKHWQQIGYASSSSRYFAQWDDDVIQKIVSSDGPPSVGEWTHFAMRRSGTWYTLFVDGVEQVDRERVNNDFQGVGTIVFGNACTGSYYFNGAIDDVRIYNHALSETEIMALVPEPASAVILGLGGVLFVLRHKRR